jgi:hypothetical protein
LQCHEKIIALALVLVISTVAAFAGERRIAFERSEAIYVANRLSVSPDGKTLLMDVDLGSEHERKNWDGPQPAIYAFDLAIEKTKRLTDKNDFVWDPYWLTDDEFLCVIQKARENESSVYRMLVSGKNAKLLAKHARTPSASTP